MKRIAVAGAVAVALSALIAGSAWAQDQVIGTGTFEGASGHVTSGSVSVVETATGYEIRLGEDFYFDGAPDPQVAFGSDGYDADTLLSLLQADTGAQTYAVPAEIDASAYNEVWIWCVEFDVPLGVARLGG